jgi:hypothetical protein
MMTIVPVAGAMQQRTSDAEKRLEELMRREEEAALKRREEALDAEARRRAEMAEFERQMERVIPLEVQVVVTRFQGEKKVSSFPYQLLVNAVHRNQPDGQLPITSLRMAAQIPLSTMAAPTVDGKPVTGLVTTTPVQYKEIGTFIDAWARFLENGASFDVGVTVEDTSVYQPQSAAQASAIEMLPVLRTFRSSNRIVLKDGQTKQFTLAADRVSGEILRVDVTLKVAK